MNYTIYVYLCGLLIMNEELGDPKNWNSPGTLMGGWFAGLDLS